MRCSRFLLINEIWILFIYTYTFISKYFKNPPSMGKHATCWNDLHTFCWPILSVLLACDSRWQHMSNRISWRLLLNNELIGTHWFVFSFSLLFFCYYELHLYRQLKFNKEARIFITSSNIASMCVCMYAYVYVVYLTSQTCLVRENFLSFSYSFSLWVIESKG
jgi:hypothetical protein